MVMMSMSKRTRIRMMMIMFMRMLVMRFADSGVAPGPPIRFDPQILTTAQAIH